MGRRDAHTVSQRQRRVLRGGAASAVAVLLAAVSHSYGGGTPPGPWLVLAAVLLAWPIATLLASARLGLAGVALGALVAQSLLHVAFALTDGAAPAAAGGHHHTDLLLGAPAAALSLPDAGMLTAHALAAVVAFAVLGFGRRALRAVSRGVRAAVRRIAAAVTLPDAAPGPLWTPPSGDVPVRWRAGIRRRGPPRIPVARAS